MCAHVALEVVGCAGPKVAAPHPNLAQMANFVIEGMRAVAGGGWGEGEGMSG